MASCNGNWKTRRMLDDSKHKNRAKSEFRNQKSNLILQGWLFAPFFVWRVCSWSGFLVLRSGLFCVRGVLRIHIERKLSNFVSFTGAFTDKCVVKSVKEACETVNSIPKETCQHTTQFDRPCKTACFWWVKETPKDAQECDLGLCKFVGDFHVFPSSYLLRRKGPAVPKRDQQKLQRKSLYIFQTHEDARGPHVINFLHLLLW